MSCILPNWDADSHSVTKKRQEKKEEEIFLTLCVEISALSSVMAKSYQEKASQGHTILVKQIKKG